jgi:signal transduction histidine kinase
VILCGFAAIVGVLTDRRLHDDFGRQVAGAADDLQRSLSLKAVFDNTGRGTLVCATPACPVANLSDYASPQDAIVRIVSLDGSAIKKSRNAPFLSAPLRLGRSADIGGFRVETRRLAVTNYADPIFVQYARKLSDVDDTAARVRFFLGLGVLAGAALALLAGLATATRAMSPIASLTEAARTIARTRDPSIELPKPASKDEVAELAETLEDMLRSLDDARAETEAALSRQREFVADASHELRTPLTSVLANLEILEEELSGDQRDAAASALRSTHRMRRLVGDLLLLARADAGRAAPQEPVDLSSVVIEAAAELEPVARDHELSVDAEPGAIVTGARDELHRLVLNLMENAIKHTAPGTPVRAIVRRNGPEVVLVVEDEGPGVPKHLAGRIFERFVRGGADRGGSSGLGLSIVRAVAETHGGSVTLEPSIGLRGARFVVRLPAGAHDRAPSAETAPRLSV